MTSLDRINQIQHLINRAHRISLDQISEQFDVSNATARRDLDYLAQQGKIQRIRGGAILIEKAPPELPVFQRRNEQTVEKEKIGTAAAALIQEGDTIFLGSGTTVLEVANHIQIYQNLTVITNSLLVVNALASRQEIDLIILGGIFRRSEHTMYGHLTEQNISQMNPGKVFLGFRAISLEHGLTNDFLPEVSTDRAILERGEEVIITADHTKFNRVSTVSVHSLARANKIVTDDRTSREVVAAITEKGIEVIIA
jgi:DeoR family transcriptional regulator of aga operon